MTLLDFIIGALIANAIPHLIFGLTKTHFLGLFGYSPKGNIAYAILQFFVCCILMLVKYSFSEIVNNGYLIGGITVLVLYFIFGKFMIQFYGDKTPKK